MHYSTQYCTAHNIQQQNSKEFKVKGGPSLWALDKGPYVEWPLQWRHNDHGGVLNHQPHGCILNRLFRRRSKKTSKLRVTGLCVGNSPGTGEFPAQRASNAENGPIWWRHHDIKMVYMLL